MMSAPVSANASRNGSTGEIIRWTSNGFEVCGRSAFTTPGPIVRLGTKWPSMGAGGDLGNDAAIGLVRVVLADDGLGEDLPIAGDQRDRAVVAGRFEAQNNHFIAISFGGPLPEGATMH